jgi:predicted nuclease of predicted toxin-antitoxin system
MNLKPVDEFAFLVDVNLPKKFRFFNWPNFIHVVDINPCMTDKMIWDYALKNNLVILTKDTDFYNLFLMNDICPKVIYFQIGNFTLSSLHQYFQNNWQSIISHLNTSSFIMAGIEKINVIR